MNRTVLTLPERAVKPRTSGLTMVIDGGVPLGLFTDQIELGAEYIDFVKFGWGTSVVTNCLREKISVLDSHGIGFYFGGTLFEKFVAAGALRRLTGGFCEEYCAAGTSRCPTARSSMSNAEKAGYIRKLAPDFTVVSEVGFKDPGRSEMLPPSEWVASIKEDLDAGASLVTLEARESGCIRHLPPRRRAAVRPDRGRAARRHRHRQPALRGAEHRAADPHDHQDRAGREPGQRARRRRHRPGDAPARAAVRHADRLRVTDHVRQTVRTTSDVFHLAIPTHDLDAAQDFYVTKLGCKLARRYHDRITLDFFGDQVVCHLTPGEPADAGEPLPQALRRHVPRGGRLRGAVRLRGHQEDPLLPRRVAAVRRTRGGAPHVRAGRPGREPPRVQALQRPPDDVLS